MAGGLGGAPVGNQNGAKGKRWRDAIQRALARASNRDIDHGLDKVADQVVRVALKGDKWAIDHIADRIDGKPKQDTETNVDGKLTIEIKPFGGSDAE